jgi:hypothetical protein
VLGVDLAGGLRSAVCAGGGLTGGFALTVSVGSGRISEETFAGDSSFVTGT